MTTLASSSTTSSNSYPPPPTRRERWLDFGERVIWTGIQSMGGATLVVLSTEVDWEQGLLFVGLTTLAAVAKVGAAQRFGSSGLGDIRPE